MSLIQSIRDKGAWIVFAIIALALIAFILQDGVGRGNSGSSSSTIGKINGEKIDRLSFEGKLQMAERMYAQQGATREQLIGSVWNQEIQRVVLNQEYKKLGLVVTPKELGDILYGPNSPLRQEFTDPKTGQFMVENARQTIASLKKSKNSEQIKTVNDTYIEPSIQQTLGRKYQSLLLQAAYVPKWMAEKLQADNNAIASISYVYVPYQTVADSLVKVADEDISAYVKKHEKEFTKEEETRNLSYVSFSAAPSGIDTADALNQVLSMKEGLATTTDPEAFLSRNGSDMQYFDGYFSKTQMQQSNKDSLVNIPVGQVYGPYLDEASFLLAKMIATRQMPDSASVRHILIGTVNARTNQIIRDDSAAKKLADSIAVAVNGGADFNGLVLKYSDDEGSKNNGGLYEKFPQGQMVAPFNEFAFGKPVGSKGVVKTDFGYHYIEVLGQKGNSPTYKIAYFSKRIIAGGETISEASMAAAQFVETTKSAKNFSANASKLNKPVLPANEVKENDFMIQGVGNSRELVRWVYENSTGAISEPIEIGDQYVVAMINTINKVGLATAAQARPMVEGIVRNEKKAKSIIDTKFKGTTLEAIASSTGSIVQRNDSLSFSAPYIPGIGSEAKITGAAFNKSLQGKMSGAIQGATGVFAIRVEGNSAKPAETDPLSFKKSLLDGVRMAANRGLDALRKSATIKDDRSKFY